MINEEKCWPFAYVAKKNKMKNKLQRTRDVMHLGLTHIMRSYILGLRRRTDGIRRGIYECVAEPEAEFLLNRQCRQSCQCRRQQGVHGGKVSA